VDLQDPGFRAQGLGMLAQMVGSVEELALREG
jgi:hypothetical protein